MKNEKNNLLKNLREMVQGQPKFINLLRELIAGGADLKDILKQLRDEKSKKIEHEKEFPNMMDEGIEDSLSDDDAKEIVKLERQRNKYFFIQLCKKHSEEKIRFWLKYVNYEDINISSNNATPILIECQKVGLPIDIMNQLLEIGADVHARDANGDTVLSTAIGNNLSKELVELFLERGADIDVRDKDENTPLMLAIKKNLSKEVIKFLLERGANIDEKDKDGNTPLMLAIKKNLSEKVIKFLLEKGDSINAKNNNGDTALRIAVDIRAANKIIDMLLDYGANPIQAGIDISMKEIVRKNKLGKNKLMYLLEAGQEVRREDLSLREILKHDKNEKTVFMYAIDGNVSEDVLDLLIEYCKKNRVSIPGDRRLLRYAIRTSDAHKIQMLIQKGFKINKKSKYGITPLMDAMKYKSSLNMVKFLVEKLGADVNAMDNCRMSVLMYALKYKASVEVIDFLLSRDNIDVNAMDNCRMSVLVYALKYKASVKVIDLLLSRDDIDVNAVDKIENSVLMHAVKHKACKEVINKLIRRKAELNVRNNWGNNELMIAVKEGASIQVIKLLLEKGANLNVKNNKGNSVLIFAVRRAIQDNSDIKIIELLLENGANVNETYNNGNSILMIAVKEGASIQVIKLLLERGADVNIVNRFGENVLKEAVDQKVSPDMIKLLFDYGANPLIENRWGIEVPTIDQSVRENKIGKTKLMYYLEAGRPLSEVEPLLNEFINSIISQYGKYEFVQHVRSSINCLKNNKTLLMYAIDGGVREDVLELLIEHGADINMITPEGETLLTYATKRSTIWVIGYLIKAGLDINEVDQNGNTPLMVAIKSRRFCKINSENNSKTISIIKYILDEGARVEDESIIELARENNVLNYLLKDQKERLEKTRNMDISQIDYKRQREEIESEEFNKRIRYSDSRRILNSGIRVSDEGVIDLARKNNIPSNIIGRLGNRLREEQYEKEESIIMVWQNALAERNINIQGIEKLCNISENEPEKVDNILKKFLGTIPDIDAKNDNGTTLLMTLVKHNVSANIVKFMLDKGAQINVKNKWGGNVLMSAVRYGKVSDDVIQLLINRGADINTRSKEGCTALMLAHRYNVRKSIISELIKYGANPLMSPLNEGAMCDIKENEINKTMLMYVLEAGNQEPEEIIKFINDLKEIKCGNEDKIFKENLNESDKFGKTPLMYAVDGDVKEIVLDKLIESGADIKKRLNGGKTLLMYAVKKSNINIVQMLLKRGLDVNERDNEGVTALMYAIKYGVSVEIVELLLKAGAKINAKDNNNCTAIGLAYEYKRSNEIIEKLMDYGANPLVGVSRRKLTKTMYEIIKEGQFVNKNKIEKTELMYALEADAEIESIKLFLREIKRKSEINKADKNGKTPIMYLMEGTPNKDVVELIIACGADIKVQTPKGETLLTYSVKESTDWGVKLLQNRGLDINEKDRNGCTPLMTAIENKNIHAKIEFLLDIGACVGDKSVIDLAKKHNVPQKIVERLKSRLEEEQRELKEVKQEFDIAEQRENVHYIPQINDAGFSVKREY